MKECKKEKEHELKVHENKYDVEEDYYEREEDKRWKRRKRKNWSNSRGELRKRSINKSIW